MALGVTPEFEDRLRAALPSAAFKEPNDAYFTETRGRWTGHGMVVAPSCTEEVSIVLSACHAAGVAVVPYGGGTGLVGGQMIWDGPKPIVLSLERMNAIREVFPNENVLIAEAGAILADVQGAAAEVDQVFPLSLASEGSARIGGLLSTNAGGLNVLRYGNARAQCLGLEVVLPDGQIWNGLSRLHKDNTGYDLRNLMIGAEGTLGVITAASLKLVPQPSSVGTAMMVVGSPEQALDLLALARAQMAEGISAFELIDGQGFTFLDEVGPDYRQPFEQVPEWTVLIEVGLPKGLKAHDALAQLFETSLALELVSDGVIAQSAAQREGFWRIREGIPEANRRIGSISSHDISVPLGVIPDFIRTGPDRIQRLGDFRINCFGHLGDGNLHYNVFPPKGMTRADFTSERDLVKRAVHDLVHEMGGSVSAEHGVGRLKVDDLERYGDPVKLSMMRAIKRSLDPKGIMNPGAVLRSN